MSSPVGLIPCRIRSDCLRSARLFGSAPRRLAVRPGASPSPVGLIPFRFLVGIGLCEAAGVAGWEFHWP
eukprot:5412649-Heterocapsa_arctica.AAC.1